MIQPTNIDHTVLIVTSLERAKAYYERLFDFDIRPLDHDPRTLAVESEHVHFFITEKADAPQAFLEHQHISFEVADLEEVIENLDRVGVVGYKTGVFEFFRHRNYRWCEWRDPDGIRVECVERLA